MKYSIVIPIYKSGAWLKDLVARIEKTMEPLGEPYEVVLVNDCSPDGATWAAIEALAQDHDCIRGYDLLYNVGQFRATLCGMEQARGEYIITMDDDLQHPPEELPKLIGAMAGSAQADCVFGIYARKRHSLIRNLGSRLYGWLNHRIYDCPRDIKTSSFRIMKRELTLALVATRLGRPFIEPMILRLTRNVRNITVLHEHRVFGESGYDFGKCVALTWQHVVNGSLLPLRLFTSVGFCASAFAFSIGVYYLLRKLTVGIGVTGYASLMVALSFFSGLILAAIGILGEYIARMIQEVSGPPRYMIKAATERRNVESAVSPQSRAMAAGP